MLAYNINKVLKESRGRGRGKLRYQSCLSRVVKINSLLSRIND